MLGRRDHSEKELKDKLLRYYEAADVETALLRAREERWLREPNELAKIVAQSYSRRGKGRLRVAQELKKRGLPHFALDNETEILEAQKLIDKLIKKDAKLTPELRAKIYRRLAYRGFTADIISLALKAL
jgi:regulatory protein